MSPFIEQLGWVLIHSLWQLALLAAASFVVQRAMQRTSAAARYAALLALLVLVVAAPLITWSVLPTPAAIPVAELPDPVPARASEPAPQLEPVGPALAPAPVTVESTPPITAVTPVPPEPIVPAKAPEPLKPSWSQWAQQSITPWLSTIVWGWSLGVLAFAIRPLWSWFTVRQLRTQGVSPVSESVQAALAETARRLGMTQAVRVLQSTIVQVPIVAGYLKPVILLPASIVTGLPASQLEAILAHELAHIRRHDYLANLIQTLVETVFFYHPAVWWLSHQIRSERENCCDDIAVAMLGNRLDYSRALLAVEELRGKPTTLAVGASGGSLLGRVRRLFHRDVDPGSLSSGSVALGVVLVVGVLAIAAIAGSSGASAPKNEDDAFEGPVADETSWPQLGGGATHNPVSTVTNLPTQFDLTKRVNIRWSQPIGDFAFSSPVVSGGKVLIGTNNAIGRDPRFPASIDRACLQCFDERTGEFLWQYSSPKMEQGRRHDWPSIGICSTPVIEGDRVWFATNRCEIVCLDLNGHRDNEDDGEPEASAPGEAGATASTLTPNPSPRGRGEPEMQRADVVWKYDMFNTLGVRPLNATCVTPVIAGDLLLLNSGNDVDESYVNIPAPEAPAFLAFHKTTGQLIWSDKTPNSNILGNGCSMGAPAVAKIDGVWQAIFAGYDGWLYAFDLESIQRGETLLLWKFDLNPKESQYQLNGPRNEFTYRGLPTTPVVVGDHVFAAVGHNPERGEGLGRLWCIDATKRGDLSSDLVYNKSAPDVVIPHKRAQACEPDKGDFTRPNPNSGVEWIYTTDDLNKNGKIEYEEQMHLSNSLPAIHDGLLLTTDLSGLVHCLDVATGELLWTHDQLATCWSGPLLADGKAWVIDEDGDLSIFALSREKQLIAEIAMNSPGYTNFAAANQTLYVATKTQLVAIGSGEFPKPDGVTAKLPGGLEIELVGVTPNAAPTSEGWRVDGSLIERAGDWPRGATFSNDGDRFTITTDGASKLPPNPLARDLLFESRGLRSHPAWVILNQKGLTQFESVNADETIRRRLSYLPKESGQPLTIEMALTDSPWGPWQQIDKSGKRINTITTFEPDQKLYEEIKFLRFGPALEGSAQRPLELVLEEPATHDDYQSGVFDITVRFIGTDQKVWTTYAQPKPRQNGRRQVVWRTGGDVPLEKIDHVEFRLRPYRHFITFKNVPLDRTTGAQVAVEHRSLPLPPTHEPAPRFTAQVPGGIEIELLRIVRNDLPEDQSWTPDGKPSPGRLDWPQRSHYKVRPDGNGYSSSNEGPGSDRVWDLVYEVRSSGSKPFASVDLIGDGSVSSSQFSPAIGPRLVTVIPKDPKSLTAFQLRVGTEPWGEWIQVGADGEILNPEAIRTATDAPDRLVTHMRAGLDAENLDRSWLQWRTPQNHNEYYQMEVRAIDDDGRITESHSTTHSVADRTHAEITKSFNLPLDRLTRFEYRLRPYRHLVRFDQICTDPAKPTEVKVDVTPIVYLEVFPSPEAAVKPTRPLVAKLPSGLEVELVGVTKNFAPSKDGWKPDGSPIGEVADWQATRVFRRVGESTVFDSKGTPHPDARDYLFEMRGFRSPPSYETNLFDPTSWNDPELAKPHRTRLSMLLKESADSQKFSVKVTDDPWGPYQRVGPDGSLLNELKLTELEKKYYDKIRVEHCGPDPANPGEGELSLQFQESFMLDEKDWGYDFEVRAIGRDGQPLKDAYPWNSSHILNRTTLQYLTSDHLPADKIARWEYRLRPYRHFITFENVSFEPGEKTEPKVSVESIAAAEPPKKFIAQVPDGIEVELLGTIRELKNRDRLSLAPDGSLLPSLKPYLMNYGGDPFMNMKLGFREFEGQILYQVRGGDSPTVDVRGPSRFGMHAVERDTAEVPTRYLMGHALPTTPMTFTAKVADEPWGEWIHVSPTGQILNARATQLRHAAYYDKITIGHAGESQESTTDSELKLNFPQGFFDSCRLHLRIVPEDGQKREYRHGMRYGTESFTQSFNLPHDQVERFEFRLRPYRHLVKFENVSLDPEKPTEPKVSVVPIPVFQVAGKDSDEAEAQPQPRIDLIGLTYDSVPKKETWNTNGQPLLAPEWVQQLPKLYGDDKSQPAPLYLFEVHGLRAKPSFRHRYRPAVVSGDDEVPEGRPYRMAVLYEDLKPEERNQFIVWGEHPAVRITDEPWGPWRTITKEGQFAEPVDPNTLYREGYDMVTLHGFRPLTKKPNDPEPAPDAVRTGLVLKHPMDYDALYAIEIEAVPSTAGPQLVNVFTSRPVQRFRNEAKDRWDIESEWPVDPTKIDHLRYRIRPYRHRFEFQEVAYKQYERPATSAPFKVIYKKLEHDMPKPMASQTRSLKNEPRVPGQVLLFTSDVDRSKTPPESVLTIEGGVRFILENSPMRINGHLVPTRVELSADRAVIWTPEDAESLGKDGKIKEDSAFQIYLEGDVRAQLGKEVIAESNAFYNFDGRQGTLFGIEPTTNDLRDQPLRARADAVRDNVDGKFSATEISKKIVATLPGGLELELLGVTPYREPSKESWTPYGKKFDPAPEWASRFKLEPLPPGGMSDLAHEDYRDFIVRAGGFSPEQLALLPFAERFESSDSTIGRMQVLTWNQQVQRLRIGIPGEWGPYRVLTVDPKVPPKAKSVEVSAEVPAPYRKAYETIQPKLEATNALDPFWEIPQSFPPDYRPDEDVKPANYTRIVWKGQPANPDLKYTTVEAVLVDLQGKRHTTTGTTILQDGQSQWDVDLFRVPFEQVSHVEYRLRPYQHVVTFNNVALHPGVECGPNVVVESPLAAIASDADTANSQTLSTLIQGLSNPDQSVRDRATAQLKSVFKPSAREPWRKKVESIPRDAPRAEVFEKLGIDEKRDLYGAEDTMEQYRLDDTWMARIWFTGDLQKLNTIELVEQLHRPWVDPPADFTGTWVTYYVNGEKAHEIDYRNGKYHGRHRSYHANGQLLVQQHYTDQVANGEDTGYFASGKLMYRGLYEDDKQVGPWIHYNEDGTERSRTEHPKPTRPKTSGKLLTEIRVVDDATGQPVTGGKVTVRWSFDRHALEIVGKPVRNVFDFQEEFDLTEQGTFPIRIPAGMEDAKLHVQESVKHPDYVIEQSFGAWQVTPEMAADPALLKAKLFAGRPIKLKRGHEVSGLVTDGLGQPVAGVRVYAAMQMPEYLNMPPHAVTDTQGRYKFRVPEHDGYQLMFVPADRDKSETRTDKPADFTALAQVNLVAQSIPIRKQYGEHPVVKLVSGTRIVGVVRDSAGRPLPNIVVQANDDDSVYMGFPNVMSRVVTDAEGRYEMPAQKLPVDVRIARHNQRGGWSEPASIPADVYLPEFVTERWGKLRVGDENVYEVDFAPVKTVTLRARAYNAKGQPDADAEIELVAKVSVPGAGPDQRLPQWRRTFTAVPGEVGLYELKAPQGLLDVRIDLTGEGLREPAVGTWTRAAREEEKLADPRTRAAWPVLDRDDDSIIIGEPAAVALNPPGADASGSKPELISELGLWGVPVSADEVLALGVTRTPPVPGGVRITAIEPGGYIDSQIQAGKLKFAVREVIHSVAARDVTSAKDVSRNILATRREGHSGFFIGTASPTGLGRFSVEFSELLTDPQTGQLALPPLAFHIASANAVKEPVDESGHAWFPIGGDFSPKRYESAHKNWDHLKLPVEKTVDDRRLGLVADSAGSAILWDGSWRVEKCELTEDPKNPNQFLINVMVDSHGAELLRKLTTDHLRERLAIVVEERIVLAPTIVSVIESQFSITGKFTKAEGEQLVQAIRRGMKPAVQAILPQTRIVSLKVESVPRRKVLEQLAREAGLEILFEEAALAQTEFDLDQPMTLVLDEVPLWQAAWDVCELPTFVYSGPVVAFRKNMMEITTMESEALRARAALPEWLAALQSQGVGGTTEDDGQVTGVTVGGKGLSDELLARIPELKHLKELTLAPGGPASDESLAALSKLHSLETLRISSSETRTSRTDQVLSHVKLLPNLKTVSFHESGVSDVGIAHLAESQSLEQISIYQDGWVTDRGIELIAGMSQLKGLSLTQYVFLQDRPKMKYSPEALTRLGQLTQLESLSLDGIEAPASLQLPTSLKEITLTGKSVDDAMAARVAACSNLKSLSLRSTAVTDEGLRQIAAGTKLTSVNLWETPITDAGMEHLTTHPLRTIELRGMRLGDATLTHFARIKTLNRLTLWAGGQPRVSISAIGEPNDQAPVIASMTVSGMRVLKDLPQLRSLCLYNFPSNANYAALGELKQLREISMLMSLTEVADLEALEAALPDTRITAATGGGLVRSDRPAKQKQRTRDEQGPSP